MARCLAGRAESAPSSRRSALKDLRFRSVFLGNRGGFAASTTTTTPVMR
jgi:hypothetical protein